MIRTYWLCILILCSGARLFAQTPYFCEPEYLFANGDTLQVEFFSAPYVYDWDGDTDKDLLVGQFVYGHILYYENIGTHQNPVFSAPIFLEADDSIITLPFT